MKILLSLLLFLMIFSDSYTEQRVAFKAGIGLLGKLEADIKTNNGKINNKMNIVPGYNFKIEYNFLKLKDLYIGLGLSGENELVSENNEFFGGVSQIPVYLNLKYNFYRKGNLENKYYLNANVGYIFNYKQNENKYEDGEFEKNLYYSIGLEKEFENYLIDILYEVYNFEYKDNVDTDNTYLYDKVIFSLGYKFSFKK